MRPGASALWPGQASARCGLGQAPYGLGKRPIQQPGSGHGKRTASKLGMRPVTLRRISQHPPVTSKLGLSSRLDLPAHFHRQPGFSYVWIVNKRNKRGKDYKHKTGKQKCKPCVRTTRGNKCSSQQTRGMSKTEIHKEFQENLRTEEH